MSIFYVIDRYYDNYYLKGQQLYNFINETTHSNDKVGILGYDNSNYYDFLDNEVKCKLSFNEINSTYLELSKEILLIDNKIEEINGERNFKRVINRVYDNLEDSGFVILRIINFDKIVKNGELQLPIIEVDLDNSIYKLQKKYRYVDEDNIEVIYTMLDCNNIELRRECKSISYNMRRQGLNYLLNNVGFKELEFYSSFYKEEYNEEDSNYLIIRGIKKEELLKDSPEYEEYDENILVSKKRCAKGNCAACSKQDTDSCCKNKNNNILIKK